jgi:hypothetical protein
VKDPGAQDKKPQGGGRKIRGDEGKLGLHGADKETGIPGDTKPTTHYGGLSEVLDGDTGKEIQRTLKTIDTVSAALAGLNADSVSLGGGLGHGPQGRRLGRRWRRRGRRLRLGHDGYRLRLRQGRRLRERARAGRAVAAAAATAAAARAAARAQVRVPAAARAAQARRVWR